MEAKTNQMVIEHNPAADRAAQQVIRSMLMGGEAPAEMDITPDRWGQWAETVQLMCEAQRASGTAGMRRALSAATKLIPALIALLATDFDVVDRKGYTVAQLYDAHLAAPDMVVEDLLPVGVSILAGRPKKGKSWLGLEIAAAVGMGDSVLGLRTKRGRVLYLALEDSKRRIRDRMEKQHIPRDAAITFFTTWEPLSQAGLTDLMGEAVQGYSLVIVDTLSRSIGRADQMDAADMTMLLGNLQRLAISQNLAILLIDHHRKPNAASLADPVDDIFGSTAKAGVIDTALGLYREHNDDTAVLKITGRDICERELALRWDAASFRWECQGEAQATARSVRQQEVVDALGTLGKVQLRDLADATGQSRTNLFGRLQKMVQQKLVVRVEECGQVFYSLA